MPVYEYQCQSCKRVIEKIQKFSDPPLTQCEACGGLLKKLLSPPALVFKGSGFYITDYSQKGKGKDEKSSTEKAKESGSTSATPSSTTSTSPSSSSPKEGSSSE